MIKRERIIYGLMCPFTNEVFYIGKSIQGRLRAFEHMTPSRIARESNKKNDRVKSILSKNVRPKIVVIYKLEENDNIDALEMAWTCLYKSIDQASCNESYGTKKTDQQKKRISEWQTGKPLSTERKKNISKALSKVYFENGTEKIMTVVDMAKRMNKSVSWIYYKISKGDKIGDFFIRH